MTLDIPFNRIKLPIQKFNFEAVFLLLVWGTYFSTINVNWTGNWVARSFLPDIAPHTAIAIPLLFFMNVYWLIPQFLNRKKWMVYLLLVLALSTFFELGRSMLFSLVMEKDGTFMEMLLSELTGKNNLLFGELNFLTFNFFLFSFFFRFTKDWASSQSLIKRLQGENSKLRSRVHQTGHKTTYVSHLFIKKKNSRLALGTNSIVYIRAQGDFVLCTDNQGNRHIINDSLKNTYKKLDPREFFQINRSEIVNIAYIEMTNPYIKNRLEISLKDATQLLYTSNSRTPQFRLWFKNR